MKIGRISKKVKKKCSTLRRKAQLPITQHKRFVPYGTHPNFAFSGTSFMLEWLCYINL